MPPIEPVWSELSPNPLTTLRIAVKPKAVVNVHRLHKMAKETLKGPQHPLNSVAYDTECKEVLTSSIDRLLDEAEAAGWDRSKAASTLMYLSAKRFKPTSPT